MWRQVERDGIAMDVMTKRGFRFRGEEVVEEEGIDRNQAGVMSPVW